MEPVELTAAAIITLIFTKAVEKSGEKLGEAVLNKISQLVNIIRSKFKASGVEGILTKAQENPTDKNKSKFQNELVDQMEEDEEFAKELKELVDELKSNDKVNQIFFKNVKVSRDVSVGDIEQETTGKGSVNQEAVVDVEVGGNLNIGNVKQRG